MKSVVIFLSVLLLSIKVYSSDKAVLCSTELISFPSLDNAEATALIDTGATTSSLDVRNMKISPAAGQSSIPKVVSFQLPFSTGVRHFRLPIRRFAYIITHNGPPVSRPVVELPVYLRGMEEGNLVFEFSLVDRSNFPHPVLIGRNLLHGNAVVDVSCRG